MKIGIAEFDAESKSATGVRGRAIAEFLRTQGHHVDIIGPAHGAVERFHRSRLSLRSRVVRKIRRQRTLPHLWDFLADTLQPQIDSGNFDAVIARGQEVAYAFTRTTTRARTILDMANIGFMENYYSWNAAMEEVDETFRREVQLFDTVDHILSPHPVLSDFFLNHIAGFERYKNKLLDVRLGCESTGRRAQYSATPRIVYAGSYYRIQDPYLLAQLTSASPAPVDCYGPTDPTFSFLPSVLNYHGYPPEPNFLSDYQVGLITVSKDKLRQFSPATKFPYYFSYGLPVLFPEWMQEGHEYGDCAVAFNENNFAEKVKHVLDRQRWTQMSDSALRVAGDLSWDKTLQPLQTILTDPGNTKPLQPHNTSEHIVR